MRTGQLTFEDVIGTFDYTARSTAEKFLKSATGVITYAVDFYDKDEKQKLRWFEAKTKSEANSAAKEKYGRNIIINDTYISDKSLKEIMEMD